MRDHETAQKKYDEIRAKEMTAQVAESLEDDQKAERFSLLEPPLFPDKPITEKPLEVSIRTITVIIVRARFQPSDWAVESGMG